MSASDKPWRVEPFDREDYGHKRRLWSIWSGEEQIGQIIEEADARAIVEAHNARGGEPVAWRVSDEKLELLYVHKGDCFRPRAVLWDLVLDLRDARAQLATAKAAGREEGLREAAEIAESIGGEEPWFGAWPRTKRIAATIRARLSAAEPQADTGEKR